MVDKSLGWLRYFLQKLFEELPRQRAIELPDDAEVDLLRLEAAWSFVGEKSNKEWIWLAMERNTRQIVGYRIGPGDEEGALGLWFSIPKSIREKAPFFTKMTKTDHHEPEHHE